MFTGVCTYMFKIFTPIRNCRFFNKTQSAPVLVPTKINFRNVKDAQNSYVTHNPIAVKYGNSIGTLKTEITHSDKNKQSLVFNSYVFSSNNEKIGGYKYKINKQDEMIENGYIETKLCHRRQGIGEIMRLASLIELKENNIKGIDIYAISTAIPFHLKYKFKPNITTKKDALTTLGKIENNQVAQDWHKKTAKNLTKEIKNIHYSILNTKLAERVNNFIESYIKQHLYGWKEAKFDDIPMILTSDKIKQCAGFYNKLFKKHGIDYQI